MQHDLPFGMPSNKIDSNSSLDPVFSWSDNDAIRNVGPSPYKKNNPQQIKFNIYDTTGKEHVFQCKSSVSDDWDSDKWICTKNRWYNHKIRTLLGPWPGAKLLTRTALVPWTIAEKEFLESLIEVRIQHTRNSLRIEDWKVIADDHNEKFEGTTTQISALLTRCKIDGTPQLAAKSYIVPARSISSLQNAVNSWADTCQMMKENLEAVRSPPKKVSRAIDAKRKAVVLEEDDDIQTEEESDGSSATAYKSSADEEHWDAGDNLFLSGSGSIHSLWGGDARQEVDTDDEDYTLLELLVVDPHAEREVPKINSEAAGRFFSRMKSSQQRQDAHSNIQG